MRGELLHQAAGAVQCVGVGGGVDDEDHGVEAAARDVVRVAVARAVGRVVVGGEDQPGAYRIAGVVHGEDRGAGRGRVADLGAGALLQSGAQAQRRVHQLLETEDQDLAGVLAQGCRDAVRHGGESGFQEGAVCGGEAVPAAVGHSGGPLEVDPGVGAGKDAQRLGPFAGPPHAGLRSRLGRFLLGDQGLPLLQDTLREADRARVPRHQVDPGADLLGELGKPPLVGR